jgi:hypothetical protein
MRDERENADGVSRSLVVTKATAGEMHDDK